MKVKPNRYYKELYIIENIKSYYFYTTDTKCVYEIAYLYNDTQLVKYNTPINCGSIKEWQTRREWQEDTNTHSYNVKEISKGDVFLEML